MQSEQSYGHILKSTSIMGGAAGITMLLGMIRTKFAAVLIGSTGVGLIAGFTAIQGLIGTIAGLGIQSSAVREIAVAVGKGDAQAIGRAVLTLRRICWLTGFVGMMVMMAFSPLLSRLTFNSDAYTLDIAALGVVILLANLTGGQIVLLQGTRRIGSMARAKIGGAIFATLSAIGFYYWLGLRGIVPSLVSIAAVQLAITWYVARQIPVPPVTLTWMQSLREASGMIKLGLVLMWSALMVSAVSYGAISLITQQINLHAVGLYSAAFTLSGMFVNFVLDAMGADYYPRLAGVAQDKAAVNRLVNEQTEIGLLLALPGLLATLALAPWILQFFYSREFLDAVELLRWFILGCLGRLISWPIGYMLLALGNKRWLLLTESFFNIFHFGLITLGLQLAGLAGVAMAYTLLYIAHVVAMRIVAKRLTNFDWDPSCRKILLVAVMSSSLCFLAAKELPSHNALPACILIATMVAFYALRRLLRISGISERTRRALMRIPGVKFIS